MAASAPTKPGRTCPSCSAFVPAGRITCMSCHLAVSKMDGFLAAKTAAQNRGFSGNVDTGERPFFLKTAFFVQVALLLIVAGAIYYFFFIPKPPRYLTFPATPEAAVQTYFQHISGGQDKDFDQAYALVPDSTRNKNNSDEHGDYLQIFDVMNNYFTGEFGDDWFSKTKFTADPNDPNTIIAQVALQTVHVHTANQSKNATGEAPHYGITGMDEFDIAWAQDFRKMEGIYGVVRTAAGGQEGGVDLLKKVIGSGNVNGPPMVKKINLLATVRNPREVSSQAILRLYPFRDDPVVRNRLQMIAGDERYGPAERERAQAVIDDKVPEEEKVYLGL